jgi:hypothetical protein
MSDALEIAFEDVDDKSAPHLVMHLISLGRELEVSVSRGGSEATEGPIAAEQLAELLDLEDDMVAMFRVRDLRIGRVDLPLALVRLVKYGRKCDVDFSFEVASASHSSSLMRELHKSSKLLAQQFHAKSFFGGMEPASDAETQYFFNEDDGPLMRPSSSA